ncbi:hypothetical protein GJ744_003591 [Endocarpon pusillum]|uniref:Uncharacterized protein n=1 Tax=Endocarpon pusillum TaxID=364733 RepID=A0A8H7E0K2_9EURO|nr:hypothetical protein GJ744_003591 [Endocarpon pusillum]
MVPQHDLDYKWVHRAFEDDDSTGLARRNVVLRAAASRTLSQRMYYVEQTTGDPVDPELNMRASSCGEGLPDLGREKIIVDHNLVPSYGAIQALAIPRLSFL